MVTISSVFGATYCGFYFDLVCEALSTVANYVGIISSGSSFIGIHLYINGMMRDMKMQFTSIKKHFKDQPSESLKRMEIWSTYVREINFHNEILEYVSNFITRIIFLSPAGVDYVVLTSTTCKLSEELGVFKWYT